ncbi:MAG: hypothetical protein ACREDR_10070, partial [Blastocatellia bacterium]
MNYRKGLMAPAASILLLCMVLGFGPASIRAQNEPTVAVTTAGKSIPELLPDTLGGFRATAPLST